MHSRSEHVVDGCSCVVAFVFPSIPPNNGVQVILGELGKMQTRDLLSQNRLRI